MVDYKKKYIDYKKKYNQVIKQEKTIIINIDLTDLIPLIIFLFLFF